MTLAVYKIVLDDSKFMLRLWLYQVVRLSTYRTALVQVQIYVMFSHIESGTCRYWRVWISCSTAGGLIQLSEVWYPKMRTAFQNSLLENGTSLCVNTYGELLYKIIHTSIINEALCIVLLLDVGTAFAHFGLRSIINSTKWLRFTPFSSCSRISMTTISTNESVKPFYRALLSPPWFIESHFSSLVQSNKRHLTCVINNLCFE